MNKFLLLFCTSLFSAQAMAGSWRYGCIGSLPDHSVVNFNRATIAIVATTQPGLYAANADISKDIQVGESLDLNSGLEPTMDFRKANGDIIHLIQTRARINSHHERDESCSGGRIRTLSDERSTRTYKVVRPGEPTVRAILKCYDLAISTCG